MTTIHKEDLINILEDFVKEIKSSKSDYFGLDAVNSILNKNLRSYELNHKIYINSREGLGKGYLLKYELKKHFDKILSEEEIREEFENKQQ